jgi:hypothetical protein
MTTTTPTHTQTTDPFDAPARGARGGFYSILGGAVLFTMGAAGPSTAATTVTSMAAEGAGAAAMVFGFAALVACVRKMSGPAAATQTVAAKPTTPTPAP